ADTGLLKYQTGNVYDYAFDSILTIGLSSGVVSEADDTSLKVSGSAKIFSKGNCGYTLQLGSVKVTNTKESVEKKILNSIAKPVSFTLVNGLLEPRICSEPNDLDYSLNIKRGIISLLQSAIESQQETDVFGQCPTHTSVTKNGNIDTITKVRNLNSCSHREQINSALVSGKINEKAGLTSSFLLQSSYIKESKIVDGLIENVQLTETYKFSGATKGNSDISAKVFTLIKLKNPGGTKAETPQTGTVVRSAIFQKPETYSSKNINALKTVLSEIVESTGEYVKKDSAKKFVEFIRLLRQSDGDSLLELGTFPHPNKVLARKVYLDGLFRTNTAESARVILKQLSKFDDKEKILAILSLNLVEIVDKETITYAAAQLSPSAPKELYLSVGSLISKFCSKNNCENVPEIEAIVKKFSDGLKHCKPNTKKDEERTVYILKGLGNANSLGGNAKSSSVKALMECASVGRPNRIRIAALQAFSSLHCDQSLQSKSLQLLKDTNEDSELRIEAYLALISCPNGEIANQIAEIVNTEKVNQVGGFIASNLKAIRDSTDPKREQQRYYLGNIRITKQFPKNYRRYSFNNELSYSLETLGLGASSDYSLIYSQHGFLPRSLRINVTTEIFGTNFNVFEASVRQENLENVLEYYLGPKGLLNKDFDELVKLIEVGNSGAPAAGGRARRSIVDEASKTSKKYKSYGSKNIQDLNLDLSLKLFGSELAFLSLGDNVPTTIDDIIRHFSDSFEKAKKELSSFEKELVFNNLFLDSELIYPTSIGVPLTLQAQGFAATKVDLQINLDIGAIIEQNWQKAKYGFKFVPSADVNVNLQVGFNAQVLSTGLRVVSTGHTATGNDVSVAFINDGEGFKFDVELPREKLDLINIQIETELFVSEQDKPTKGIALRSSKKSKNSPAQSNELCFNQLEIIGLNICIQSSTSLNDIQGGSQGKDLAILDQFHLSKPFLFGITLTAERKFTFNGLHTTSDGSQKWKLDYSTPGSKVSHDTSVIFELGTKPRTYTRLSLDNTQFHFAIEGGVNNNNQELVVYGQYEQDKAIKKSKIGLSKNGNEYKPIIEIQDNNGGVTNSINGYRADGKITVQKTNGKPERYTFENFRISNGNDARIIVNGWSDVGRNTLDSELHISSEKESYQVKGSLKFEKNGHYGAAFFINDEKSPENVYGSSVQLITAEQSYALRVIGKAATWSINSDTDVSVEKDDSSTNPLRSGKVTSSLEVQNKNKQVAGIQIKTTFDSHNFDINAEILREQKIGSLNLKYKSNQRTPQDYALEAKATLNKHSIDILSKRDLNNNLYVIENVLTTSWGTSLSLKGDLGQRFSPQDIHIDIQGNLQLSNKDKPSQWILKANGTPDKTSTEFRVIRDSTDIVKVNGESQHPQDKVAAVKLNVIIKNLLTAKGDFRVAKNGKGELLATIETQKTEPKHKIEVDSKFHILNPKYDIDTTITFDGEKKLHFKSENTLDKSKFTTKNIAEANEKKLSFEANGSVKGESRENGEVQGGFKLTTPSGRIIDGSVIRKVSTIAKTGIIQGNIEGTISDTSSGGKRSLVMKGKLDRWNSKSKEFSVNTNLIFTDFDGQKSELSYQIKQQPKGDIAKNLEFKLNAQGKPLNEPIEVTLVLNDYSLQGASVTLSTKYGDSVTLTLNGNFNNNNQKSYELETNLNIPKSSLKFINIKSNGKLLLPSTQDSVNVAANEVAFLFDGKTGQEQYARIDALWQSTSKSGTYKVEAQTNNMKSPLIFNGKYQKDSEKLDNIGHVVTGHQNFLFNGQYGEQYVKTEGSISYGSDKTELAYKLDTSHEKAKDIEVHINTEKSPDDSTFLVKAFAKQTDKSYSFDTKLYRSAHKKGLDARLKLPKEKPIVFTSIVEILGERKAKIILEIDNLAELDLQVNGEASYTNIDDFYVIGSWNSKKLKLDNYQLEARAQGKNLKIQLKNASNVIFLGTTTYSLKKEQNKSIIDGQGQVTYQGKSQSGNFKLTRQHYDINTDKEVGFSYTLNGNFGSKNGVSTIKITNKEFNTKFSVCEEKKQCTNIQIQSLVSIDDIKLDGIQHSTLILIDLRELGYPYEFELKSQNTRQGLKYQYHLDSFIVSGNNLKYQFTANVQPSSSILKLTLPKRQLVLESAQKIPKNGNVFGHYEQSVAFFIDKLNRPDDVARLSAIVDVSGKERVALNAQGAIKLEHPNIRSLSVSGRFDGNLEQQVSNLEIVFDIFRLPEQKVIVTNEFSNVRSKKGINLATKSNIKSSGLKFQYQAICNADINREAQELKLNLDLNNGKSSLQATSFLNKEKVEITLNESKNQIVKFVGDFNKQKRSAKLNSKLQILNKKPLEITAEIQPTFAKLSLKRPDLIDSNAEIKLGKEFKFDISGNGKQLLNGRIALDPTNFLQTNYMASEENVKEFWEKVESEVNKDAEDISQNIKNKFNQLKQESEAIVKLAQESYPDFTKFKVKYDETVKAFIQELETDPSIAPIINGIRTLFEKFSGLIDQLTKAGTEAYEKIQKSLVEIFDKLHALWNDSILKAWEELYLTATKLITQLYNEIFAVYKKLFENSLEALKKYGPVLKNYSKAFAEFLKPLNEALQELIKVVSHAVEEVIDEFKKYAANIPTFEAIQKEINEKIESLKLVDKTIEFINSLFDQLSILPQTQETTQFLNKLHDYLGAKLKKQQINDEKILEELGELLLKSIRSIWISLMSTVPATTSSAHAIDFQTWFGSLSHAVDNFAVIPTLLSFRLSAWNYLSNENWEAMFTKEWLNSWIFFNDFELRGHIVDGSHIFSFDNQHFAYPGNCRYILAQDSVDNNFTVIAQLSNGKLKGITLIDRDGNYAEVSDTLALKLNGNAVEYPQHVSGLHAWRRFYTVHLHSEYGVNVVCTTDLRVCHVSVNGFYTSKTRGLLGNGNAEPYDDYLLIDGTISADSNALGNDYGVGKCPIVSGSADPVVQRSEICSEIFGLESPLALHFLTVDSRPYRQACDVSVSKLPEKDKEATACVFALAYGSAVKQINKFVILPKRCIKCAGPAGQRELNDEFTVKLPNNKADIVFVVDINVTPPVLNNLIAPAITDLRESLKSRGFTDVQIGVIVFDETKRYPALLTSDNGKINYKGNVANVKLNGIKNFCENCVEQIITEKRILDIYNLVKQLVNSVVPQADEKAFQMALDYPFRAGAAKSIIGVRHDSLEYKNWWKYVRAQLTGSLTKFDGALLHLIAPVKGLTLEGVTAEKLIGFNSRLVATVDGKDNKKRAKLQFDNDMGIDFVLNNGGWVFATQNFEKLKQPDQKKMLGQITTSIADTLYKTEIVSDCRCLPIHGLHGQHKCAIKSSSFLPNKKAKAH
ncbi:hypothetical protein KR200_008808, partial [Drosophila serrata]